MLIPYRSGCDGATDEPLSNLIPYDNNIQSLKLTDLKELVKQCEAIYKEG